MFALSNRRRANESSKRAKIGRRKCIFEPLETRSLLSANALSVITASPYATLLASTTVSAPYTPAEIRAAYGITGDGTGQTIAIVDAYDNPNVLSDLKAFDAHYGLSNPTFVKVNQKGSTTSLPTKNSDWGLEIALDVEWAHAVAPGAKIILVEANSASLSDLLTAVKYASTVASVVSMSWGTTEFSSETQYDSYFSTTGVTYVVSSGDTGGVNCWPAVSPNVVSVGGTTLKISSTTSSGTTTYSYSSETGWSGSGGGYSQYEKEPTWQYTVQSTGKRSTPDVSYDANSTTGFAVYDTYGYSGWVVVGGTSAGAPQWAGILATVNQGRVAKGLSTLSHAAADLYALDTTTYYSTDFYDVTSGSAGRYKAATGYDLVTGLGSPKATSLVSMLIASADTVSSTSTGSGSNSDNNSPGGPRAPGWNWFGSPGRLAELASGMGQMVSANSLDMYDSAGVASNAVDPTQLLSTGVVRISAGSSNAANSLADALTDAIMGRHHNLETILPYSNALSLNLFDGFMPAGGDGAENSGLTSGSRSDHPSAIRVVFGADSSAQAARLETPADSAVLAFALKQLHYQTVDACLSQNSLAHVQAKESEIPMLPGPEKTDVSLRAEALAAIALAYGGNRIAKNKTNEDDDDRRRVRYL
jgi:hypothetical protein